MHIQISRITNPPTLNTKYYCLLHNIPHLKAMFSSPPSSVFLWRHVNDWNYVSNLKPEKIRHNVLSVKKSNGSTKLKHFEESHLKRELISSLGNIALYDVSSSDSWNINGGLIMDQQAVSFIINLCETKRERDTDRIIRRIWEHAVIKSTNFVKQEQIQTLLPSRLFGIYVRRSVKSYWCCGWILEFWKWT